MAVLPNRFPTLPRGAAQAASAVKFCSIYHPTSSVSGDFFNVVRVSDTAVGVLICDVMGHGVRAALVTAMMRAIEGQLDEAAGDPGALLTELNRALRGILRQSGTTLFTTACYLVADVATSRITFANAGHPSPLHVRATPRAVEWITGRDTVGPALGLFEDVQYLTLERPVAEDDLILLFTDGLFEVENANDEAFGEIRLREAICQRAGLPPSRLMHDVFTEIEQFAKGRDFSDDVCLVALEIAHLNERAPESVRPGEFAERQAPQTAAPHRSP
jgi:sigma-B regulation protein RsbU (phosphoserine phosphatase)